MLESLFYVLCLIAGLVIGLLALPAVLCGRASLRRDSSLYFEIDLRLLAGVLGFRLRLDGGSTEIAPAVFRYVVPWPTITKRREDSGAEKSTPASQESDPASASPTQEKTGLRPELFLSRIRSAATRIRRTSALVTRPALRLLRALGRAVRIRQLDVSAEVGLADPAQTGQLCGLLHPLSDALPGRVRLDLRPDFTETSTSGHAQLVVHVYVGYILVLCLKFALAVARRWVWMKLQPLPVRIRRYVASRVDRLPFFGGSVA